MVSSFFLPLMLPTVNLRLQDNSEIKLTAEVLGRARGDWRTARRGPCGKYAHRILSGRVGKSEADGDSN